MKKYEYTTRMSIEAIDMEMDLLSKMGKEGWLMCGTKEYATEMVFYFVREVV